MNKTHLKYYCKREGCNNIIHPHTALYHSGLCKSCAMKELLKNPENHPNWKGGECNKQRYYCKECGCEISSRHGSGLCSSCVQLGTRNHRYGKKLPEISQKNRRIFTNKKLSKEHKKKISKNHANVKGKNNPMFGKIAKHGKGQHFKGSYMRSGWEVAYAKYLDENNIKWEFEPKVFEITYFYNNKKKEGTYTPDFYLPETNEYIEIKGYWRDDAKVKFDTFKKQYSNTKIAVLMKKELLDLGINL